MSPAWQRYRARRRSVVGLVALALLALSAAFAELLASDLPLAVRVDGVTWVLPAYTRPVALRAETQSSLRARAQWQWGTLVPWGPNQTFAGVEGRAGPAPYAPDGDHWLGTDELGRDVLARLIHGSRVSLTVGVGAVALAVLIGLGLGVLAGFFGGAVDGAISRLNEVMFTFPTVFFVIALMGVMRFSSPLPLVLVLGLTRWTEMARLARAETLRLKQLDFVLAARALGASNGRIVLRHLVPNAMGPVLVAATFSVASAILLESALSFLGLGVPPPTASWGELLTQAHRYLTHPTAWWLALFPGLAIAGTVITLNLVGEGLQSALGVRR